MSESRLVDITGRPRSPASTPGHWSACAPPNEGVRYPADPPTVEEIILVMREAGPGPYAERTRGPIAILWRAGLRISEALALTETELDPKTGYRHGPSPPTASDARKRRPAAITTPERGPVSGASAAYGATALGADPIGARSSHRAASRSHDPSCPLAAAAQWVVDVKIVTASRDERQSS